MFSRIPYARSWLRRIRSVSLCLPTTNGISGRGQNQPGQWLGMEMFLSNQVRETDPGMVSVYRHFELNLKDIFRVAREHGFPTIVSTVGVNLTYNFFSGGADLARWRQAKASLREAEKTLENVKITANSEIRTSLSELVSAQRQLALQRSNVSLVEKTRDLVEKEYAAGVASLVRLNEAQRDLTTAQNRLALALAALHQAWYNLQTDTGHILEAFVADEKAS